MKPSTSQGFRNPGLFRPESDYKEILYEINPRLYHPTTVNEKHLLTDKMKVKYKRDQRKRQELLK
jgi:hypothetical protein